VLRLVSSCRHNRGWRARRTDTMQERHHSIWTSKTTFLSLRERGLMLVNSNSNFSRIHLAFIHLLPSSSSSLSSMKPPSNSRLSLLSPSAPAPPSIPLRPLRSPWSARPSSNSSSPSRLWPLAALFLLGRPTKPCTRDIRPVRTLVGAGIELGREREVGSEE